MSPRSSCRWFRRLAGIAAALCVLFLSAGWIDPSDRDPRGAEAFWRVGVPRAIAVRDGRAAFRLPSRGPTSQTLVIVSALSRGRGPFPIRLAARPATRSAIPEQADDAPRRPPKREVAPRVVAAVPAVPDRAVGGPPPHDRVFHLMVREGDPGSAGNYASVHGVLRGVGRRAEVYVASEDLERVTGTTLEDVITTFDARIDPTVREHYGAACDVDGDGRFTILFSSWLDRLGGGRHAVDGFVKVADLDATVPAPFGNRCDMMYLNAALTSGPYLRTVLAHEYMHAVVYSGKTLAQSDGAERGPEEEGWLDEAIAHLGEDRLGFSASNIDYRVSAFLSSPERYGLVVEDYFAANLFRSHGSRGSTYLFLRWCVDRYGPELISTLIESPRRGVANVEAATGATFADIFRRWSLAMFLSGMDPSSPASDAAGDGFRSTNLHAPWAEWELAGPRYRRMVVGDPDDRWDAAGTSSHYLILDGHAAGPVEVAVAGPPEAELQVTALPLGEDRARLTLSIQAIAGPDGRPGVLAHVAESNGVPVRLSALSWEPLVPSTRHRDQLGRLDTLGIAASFGTSTLPARAERHSRAIPLEGLCPRTGPLVFKVSGTDPWGRRVTAWADFDPSAVLPRDDQRSDGPRPVELHP